MARGRPSTSGSRLAGLLGLGCLLLVLLAASIAVGARTLSLSDLWHVLLHADDGRTSVIVWQLRLPRTLMGAVVGAALGTAGALTQALCRNALAEPGLLGINAGAALAVVLGMALSVAPGLAGQAGLALFGAMIAALGVHALDRIAPGDRRGVHLVLTGAAVSASIRACTGIITMSDSGVFDNYRFWVVGSLSRPLPVGINAVLVILLLLAGLSSLWGGRLNALALGEEPMRALGLRPGATRLGLFGAIVLLCGLSTALVGPIAFLGLVVPHSARLLIGGDWRWILPYSAVLGALLLIAADILGRLIVSPGELEAGIVIAFLGAPLLLWLVNRRPI
ncbi:FecCD family ABC transporter permease [Telmatospirillum siberiense]|uniref:Iron ABC transporter permease n=1 Tax=Telmatospirillum siberiense TaxID=382514 RepID=A0A2N3Q057_9PROT|nr:iron ABC transporter permease [Telmatospirillum siberiense]PKU26038.1 iron ABC transporter permease [Telmatospirillum siberiense]